MEAKKSSIIVVALEELAKAPNLVHYSIHSPSVYDTADGDRYVDQWVFGGLFVDLGGDFHEVTSVGDTFEEAVVAFMDECAEHVER